MLRHSSSPTGWSWDGSSVYLLFLALARDPDDIAISVIERTRSSISCRRSRFTPERGRRRNGDNNALPLDLGKHENRFNRIFSNGTVSGWTRSTQIHRRRNGRWTQLTMRRSFDFLPYLYRQHGSSEPATTKIAIHPRSAIYF